jgi:hypothetical protein
MAKRAAPDEEPYRPLLNTALAASLAQGGGGAPPVQTSAEKIQPQMVFEVSRPKPPELPSVSAVPAQNNAVQLASKFEHEKRILFTRAESEALDRLVTTLARRLNAQVKVSHVIRSLVALTIHAGGEIDTRAGEAAPLVRPPNGDGKALQRFEWEIARIISSALRDAPPIRL